MDGKLLLWQRLAYNAQVETVELPQGIAWGETGAYLLWVN